MLLIAAALRPRVKTLCASTDAGLDVLVEVHGLDRAAGVLDAGAGSGVNNRTCERWR